MQTPASSPYLNLTGRLLLAAACYFGATGIGLGAFHAHGLNKVLAKQIRQEKELQEKLDQFGTGVAYQMFHALALLALVSLTRLQLDKLLGIAGAGMSLGILLFSGGLYTLVLAGKVLPPFVVPSGGVILILSWIVLAAGVFKSGRDGGEKG